MIKINKNNPYVEEFSKSLKTCLYKELKSAIENKKVETPKEKIIVNQLSIADINCLKYLKRNIEKIITGDLQALKLIIEHIENNFEKIAKKYKCTEPKEKIYLAVKYIFIDRGYEAKISTTAENSPAYRLVEKLGIKTCPYCNRNYISYLKKDKRYTKITRPQLDHFYPKSIYPFLACSFYNLIPSCSACNLLKHNDDSYKDESEGNLINPYDIKKDDFKFSYTFSNLNILNRIDTKNIKLKDEKSIIITLDTKYQKNNEYFQLERVYQEHKDIVIELILKEINYPSSYIEELIKNGFGTEEEIYRFIFSNYLDLNDLHKRPLSKLTKDIIEELGLLYKIELLIKEKTF